MHTFIALDKYRHHHLFAAHSALQRHHLNRKHLTVIAENTFVHGYHFTEALLASYSITHATAVYYKSFTVQLGTYMNTMLLFLSEMHMSHAYWYCRWDGYSPPHFDCSTPGNPGHGSAGAVQRSCRTTLIPPEKISYFHAAPESFKSSSFFWSPISQLSSRSTQRITWCPMSFPWSNIAFQFPPFIPPALCPSHFVAIQPSNSHWTINKTLPYPSHVHHGVYFSQSDISKLHTRLKSHLKDPLQTFSAPCLGGFSFQSSVA